MSRPTSLSMLLPQSVTGAAQVGRYDLLLELASGGMATVFIGRQRGAGGFERLVAIKRMHPHIGAIPELAASFLDEARIASLIHHPNVVSVHDVHESDGERLLVMDYVDGVSLAALVKAARKHNRRLPIPVSVHIIAQALRGLHAAHEQRSITGTPLNIVHRDATPQNLLLGVDGSVRITDFGIAKAAERSVHTSAGNVKGKFRYMAPEQAMGKDIDRRVDVFALGAVLWEMLSGQRFLKGDSDAEIIHNLALANFEVLHHVEPSVPEDLSAVVMRAVAERAEERWASADQFADALEGWARASGQTATATDVASLVNNLCSPQITSRRQTLMEVLDGQRPPVALTGPSPAPPASNELNTGSSASIAALSSPGNAQLSLGPPPPSRPRWQQPAFALGIGALFVTAGIVGFAASRREEAPATLASPPASTSATPAVTAPAEERVNVALTSDQPITEIRGHGVQNIQFRSDGASFTLPRSTTEMAVTVRLADGTSRDQRLVPSDNTALRLVTLEPTKPASKVDPAAKGGDSKTKGPADKPADKPPTKAVLKKSPYD